MSIRVIDGLPIFSTSNEIHSMNNHVKAYGMIHLAVIIFGFTAILGALIGLPSLSLVWWRVLIAGLGLTFFTKGIRFLRFIPFKQLIRFSIIGSLIAIHWVAFFASVKIAGASVCLVCMATTCVFVSVIEPVILKKPFNKLNFSIALLIIPGMVMVVESLEVSRYPGILLGLFSAFLAGVFASLNKKYIDEINVWQLSWIEMCSAWLTLSIVAIFYYLITGPFSWWPSHTDWIYLLILGIVCTTLAHVLSLSALKHVSAFALNLVLNLEPVYGIILAALLLHENKKLSGSFYVGATLIMISVLMYPFIQKRFAHVI
ncbi:MAG: DMT family transporter [Saprospiraceae bacterium]